MLRKFIYPILFFPLSLYINSQKALLSETNNNIDELLKEKETQIFLNYDEIEVFTVKNNQELKSLENLVNSSSFNLSSARSSIRFLRTRASSGVKYLVSP